MEETKAAAEPQKGVAKPPELVLQAVVDLESTGLSAADDEPIQVSVRCRHFNVASKTWCASAGTPEFSSLIHATRPSHPKAQQVHNIDPEKVAAAPLFPVVWDAIKKHIMSNKTTVAERVVIAGQNVERYDLPMLVNTLKRHGVPKWKPEFKKLNITHVLDTLVWSKKASPEEKKHSLGEIFARVTKTPLLRAHDASVDTSACESIIETAHIYPLHPHAISIELWNKNMSAPPPKTSVAPMDTTADSAAQVAKSMSLGGDSESKSDSKEAKEQPIPTTLMCDGCDAAFSTFFGHVCLVDELPGIAEPDPKRRRVELT